MGLPEGDGGRHFPGAGVKLFELPFFLLGAGKVALAAPFLFRFVYGSFSPLGRSVAAQDVDGVLVGGHVAGVENVAVGVPGFRHDADNPVPGHPFEFFDQVGYDHVLPSVWSVRWRRRRQLVPCRLQDFGSRPGPASPSSAAIQSTRIPIITPTTSPLWWTDTRGRHFSDEAKNSAPLNRRRA